MNRILPDAAAPNGTSAHPASAEPPRSTVHRHKDRHGRFFTWTCTCGEASRREFADPDECDADRDLHDATHGHGRVVYVDDLGHPSIRAAYVDGVLFLVRPDIAGGGR